jgi:hypothetical protein
MFSYESNDENLPTTTDARYEAVASQEEIYLEETEEDLRMILVFDDDLSPSRSESPDQPREPFTEGPITGDSDNPSVSRRSGRGDV